MFCGLELLLVELYQGAHYSSDLGKDEDQVLL